MLSNLETEQVQRLLLTWFIDNERDFPWRKTRNPYNLLIAEKLLQQTIARDHVVNAYETIITQYPTVRELAKANIRDLEEIIKPLGLTYRATELILVADEIINKHRGIIPRDIDSLLSLKGVGDYSARAILVFAFDEDVPIVDTNVARLIHRLFGVTGPISKNPARNRMLRGLAETLLPHGNSRNFNFAILDFCALICKTNSPQCIACPLQKLCNYGQNL